MFDLFQFNLNGVGIIILLLWIWILVDCLTKEPSDSNDKVAWTLFILFVPLIGGLCYYFIRRPERIKTHGQ